MQRKKIWVGVITMILALAAYQACPFLTPKAPAHVARTWQQAYSDANFKAQADCPHKSHSVCKNAIGDVLWGLGHGRWRAQEVQFTCKLWQLCAVSGDYTAATTKLCREFTIWRNGTFGAYGQWYNC